MVKCSQCTPPGGLSKNAAINLQAAIWKYLQLINQLLFFKNDQLQTTATKALNLISCVFVFIRIERPEDQCSVNRQRTG